MSKENNENNMMIPLTCGKALSVTAAAPNDDN